MPLNYREPKAMNSTIAVNGAEGGSLGLFEEIEGKRGEVLTSTLLKVAFNGSGVVRAAICGLLEQKCGGGVRFPHEAATCRTEVTTTRENILDIVVSAPTWVVAIENKIFAEFGPQQLSRYAKEIESPEFLRKIDSANAHTRILAVLLPDYRMKEVDESGVTRISWESLLESLTLSNDDPRSTREENVRALVRELNQYMRAYIDLDQSRFRNASSWGESGRTEEQFHVLSWLQGRFPDAGPITSGARWAGFYAVQSPAGRAWVGFVPVAEREDGTIWVAEKGRDMSNFEASFVVVSNFEFCFHRQGAKVKVLKLENKSRSANSIDRTWLLPPQNRDVWDYEIKLGELQCGAELLQVLSPLFERAEKLTADDAQSRQDCQSQSSE